jgi:hypothetical protein
VLAIAALVLATAGLATRPADRAGIRAIARTSLASDSSDVVSRYVSNRASDTSDVVSRYQSNRANDTSDLVSRYQSNRANDTSDLVSRYQSNRANDTSDAVSRYQSNRFITDTLGGDGHPQQVKGYRFITDTLAPGGGLAIEAAPSATGFNWADAGVGAGTAAGALLMLLGGILVVVRRQGRLAI